MKSIVITGSTRGIGFGLAESFLARDCAVMVSGRSREAVDKAIKELRSKNPENRVFGHPCDVRDPEQLQVLWNEAMSRFGKIDIWINNAGLSGPQMMTWGLAPDQVKEVVDTNILGVIFGSQIAVRGMLDQGYGSIYNMEGMGGDGRMHEGLIPYGMTKYGVNYFTRGLVKETKGKSLIVGSIRPGMVLTSFLTDQYKDRPEEFEKAKRIFNIIVNRVEDVVPWLADKILENDKSGICISYMSRWKFLFRFLSAPFTKRDIF
ncbi:MAG: SDR family oxidoreductase [Anaerolineales bacterium]|nr:MAG: SDR family oxidoreductase [Anaerolineales bacterium]